MQAVGVRTKGLVIVRLTCSAGHKQAIYLTGLGIEWAHDLAGLFDGSSEIFVHDPRVDRNSDIGRCGICRAQVKAVVEGPIVVGD